LGAPLVAVAASLACDGGECRTRQTTPTDRYWLSLPRLFFLRVACIDPTRMHEIAGPPTVSWRDGLRGMVASRRGAVT